MCPACNSLNIIDHTIARQHLQCLYCYTLFNTAAIDNFEFPVERVYNKDYFLSAEISKLEELSECNIDKKINGLFLSSSMNIDISEMFKLDIFNEDVTIYLPIPSPDFIINNYQQLKDAKFLYSIYGINKKINEHGFDIVDFNKIKNGNFVDLAIKKTTEIKYNDSLQSLWERHLLSKLYQASNSI